MSLNFGFGDFAEIYQVIQRVDPNDFETWYEAWKWMADRCKRIGDEAWEKGFRTTASVKYKNASSYYRQAEFHLPPFDHRREANFRNIQYCFSRGIENDSFQKECIDIPYGDSFLHSIFVPANKVEPNKKPPCMVCFGGLDSIKEEMYFMLHKAWPDRGISVLFVDGPGQGATLRLNGIITRYDYEAAGTAVYDYLLTRDMIDHNRIGVMGLSMGGYYVSRIAAFEHRYKAAVAWSGQYDYGKVWASRPDDHPLAPFIRWITGEDDIKKAKKKAEAFALTPEILSHIQMLFLIMHGTQDPLISLQDAERLYEGAVNSPNRKLAIFDDETLGVLHCSGEYLEGAISTSGDWLIDVFGLPHN